MGRPKGSKDKKPRYSAARAKKQLKEIEKRKKAKKGEGGAPPPPPKEETMEGILGGVPEPDKRTQLEVLKAQAEREAQKDTGLPSPGKGEAPEFKISDLIAQRIAALPFDLISVIDKEPAHKEIWQLSEEEKVEGGQLWAQILEEKLSQFMASESPWAALGVWYALALGGRFLTVRLTDLK
jgi:hypothetical protein